MYDNETLTDKQNIADKFNEYFVNIGPKLAAEIATSETSDFRKYLKIKPKCKFSFSNIDENIVKKVIVGLSSKNSYGHDEISSNLLKELIIVLVKPLTVIINQSLSTGVFPDKLKLAKVLPIYKKDANTIFSNYRPISLLSAISKVFEKIVFNQVYDYFKSNKIFYNSQYGLRSKHSTELAALELIDRIY